MHADVHPGDLSRLQETMVRSCIVLVHGTWGRTSPWTGENSELVAALRSMPDPPDRIARFPWSGRNCHKARRKAAHRLARWLRDPEMAGYDQIHLIGHSHGGNVAIAAARAAKDRVSSIVTLATPFMRATSRETDLARDPIRLLLVPVAYLLLAPIALFGLGFATDAPFGDVIEGILVSVLLTGAIYAPWYVAELAARPISSRLAHWQAPKARRNYRAFEAASTPMLCVFDERDEARLAIKLSLMASSRLKIAAWIGIWFCGLVQLLIVTLALVGWLWHPPILSWGSVTSDSLWFVPLIVFLIAFWAVGLFSLFALGFSGTITAWLSAFSLGWRSALDVMYIQLRISNLPKAGVISSYRVPIKSGRPVLNFRHSLICRQQNSISVITDWLSERQSLRLRSNDRPRQTLAALAPDRSNRTRAPTGVASATASK